MGPESPLDADVKTAVKTAVEFGANKSCEEAAAAFGSSCALPAAFRVSIHLLSKDLPFEEAIRENIMAGIQHPVCPSRQHKSQRACKCNVPLCRPVSMQWTARCLGGSGSGTGGVADKREYGFSKSSNAARLFEHL